MTNNTNPVLEQRARDLLAAEYERDGLESTADRARSGDLAIYMRAPFRAIVAALASASQSVPVEVLSAIAGQLRLAGAALPAPQVQGTPESGVITGLSIALALVESALSQQTAASSTPVRVDDALVAGAMEAAADACTHHVVCNEAITAAVEYALTSCNPEKPSCRHNFVWDEDNGGECCQKCGKVRVRQHAVPSEEAVATVIGYDPWSRVAVDWHRNDLAPGTKLYAMPQQPVGAEEVWLYKGSDGAWHTFHSEKHRLDTIADGGWDVRKFIALSQQPAASSTTVGVEWVLELADEYDTKGQHERAHYLRTLAQQPAAPHWGNVPELDDEQLAADAERAFFAQDFYEEARKGKKPWPAAPSAETVGDWVLVPRKPTLDMANAAWRDLESQGIDPEDVEAQQVWDAMLAAAPQQPAAPSGKLMAWLRMKPDGTPDWAEDCIGSDDKFLDPEMASNGYYLQPLYTAPQQPAVPSGEAVKWPKRMVNLPCPDGTTDRIVGFRVPEGDPILGDFGLSEPMTWLRKVTIERTAPDQQPAGVDGAATDSAVAAIRFALSEPEGMTFLRLWNEGEFDTLRREWPDAPVEVYVGADPLTAQHREGE